MLASALNASAKLGLGGITMSMRRLPLVASVPMEMMSPASVRKPVAFGRLNSKVLRILRPASVTSVIAMDLVGASVDEVRIPTLLHLPLLHEKQRTNKMKATSMSVLPTVLTSTVLSVSAESLLVFSKYFLFFEFQVSSSLSTVSI
jgi:hypothetical protein